MVQGHNTKGIKTMPQVKQIITLSFDELPENLQDKIILNWRDNEEYFYGSENAATLKAFERNFPIKIKDWEYGYRNYIRADIQLEDLIKELSGVRAWKWLKNNSHDKAIGWDKKYHNIAEDCPLTGYYMDNIILQPLRDFMARPDKNQTIKDIFWACLNAWLDACQKDFDYWLSEEAIREDILSNDYQFDHNGNLA